MKTQVFKAGLILSILYSLLSGLSAQVSLDWVETVGGSSDDGPTCFVTDKDNNIYITGFFYDSLDLDFGPDTAYFTSEGWSDIFITKSDSLGNLIWAKVLGSYDFDDGRGIEVDDDGNVYVIGTYGAIMDMDPGIAEEFEVCNGEYDFFLMKLDQNGNLVWQKTYGGTGFDIPFTIKLDPDNNLYLAGSFSATVTFNPGGPYIHPTSFGYTDAFIEKYDTDGNFIWFTRSGGTGYDRVNSLGFDSIGNVYATGIFQYTVDFDPGVGTFNVTGKGNSDIFIQKLDINGNFIWTKTFGSIGQETAPAIVVDSLGYTYTQGVFNNVIDFDPGPDTSLLGSEGVGGMFLLKLDKYGNYEWARDIANSFHYWSAQNSLTLDKSGNIYNWGYFQGEVDLDPGLGVLSYYSDPWAIYLQKLDPYGHLMWANVFDNGLEAYGIDLEVDENFNILSTGSFSGNFDFDPGAGEFIATSNGSLDVFLQKLKQDSCSVTALNIESVTDVTCASTGQAEAGFLYGLPPYSYEWDTEPATYDSIVSFESSGIYTCTVTDANSCSRSVSVLIGGPTSMDEYDLKSNLVVSTAFIPGFNTDIVINSFNAACLDTSGCVQLVLDSILVFNEASPEPDSILGDTLVWNFTSLYYDSDHLEFEVNVETPDDALLGDTVYLGLSINPVLGDANPLDNEKIYSYNVVGSYDPNDKQVYPPGQCEPNYILADQVLTYTVRFQNTGTSEAINIFILDTLSEFLDINSVQVVGKSHDMYVEILDDSILKFIFNDIYLPDSTTNEPESHGYVIFEVKPKSDLPNGTEIYNASSIYFDYNDPVVTNTVFNTIYDVIPVYELEQTVSICEGDTYNVGGNMYSTEGTYIDVLPSIEGCDSTVITHLHINPVASTFQEFEICDGDSIAVGDHYYTSTGTYTDVLTNIFGCDSTVNTALTVFPEFNEEIYAEICDGELYAFGDIIVDSSGIYTQVYTSVLGCDSVIELTLVEIFIDTSVGVFDDELIANDPDAEYQWLDCGNGFMVIPDANGQTFAPIATGSYAVQFSKNGCIDTSDCYNVLIESVNEIETSFFSIHPNPAQNNVNISINSGIPEGRLLIMSELGAIVYESYFIGNTVHTINVEAFATGVYYVYMVNEFDYGVGTLLIER